MSIDLSGLKPFDWVEESRGLMYRVYSPVAIYRVQKWSDGTCGWQVYPFVRDPGKHYGYTKCDSIEDGMSLCWQDYRERVGGLFDDDGEFDATPVDEAWAKSVAVPDFTGRAVRRDGAATYYNIGRQLSVAVHGGDIRLIGSVNPEFYICDPIRGQARTAARLFGAKPIPSGTERGE